MEDIQAEALARPHGPVTVFKAWVEMLHRYAASALGPADHLARLVCLAGSAHRSSRARPSFGRSRLFTLVWVILQGMFGMWTVTLRLQPAVVTAHLLGGDDPVRAAADAAEPDRPASAGGSARRRRYRPLGRGGAGAGLRPDRARRLGQQQLRDARLPGLPDAARDPGGRTWTSPPASRSGGRWA